ncbi:MAG TPA: response regulator [Pyrinomonadaceae bacterium]|nr:response regulator [Pyrinomonadaceae bacterium]
MATILIVDDDNLVRDTLHELLSLSHECHTADRAEQALAYLDVENYDVVLTDISMPGLSGKELLQHIQARHSTTPVIVISGMVDEEAKKDILNVGAFAYFAKPFKLEEIEDVVERAIARHHELNPERAAAAQAESAAADEEVTVLSVDEDDLEN